MKFCQSNSSSYSVTTELRKILRRLASEWAKVLRIDVVISPTAEENSIYRLVGIRGWSEWLLSAMISWYLPEESRAVTQLELQDIAHKFGTDKDIIAQMILSTEPEMICYILDSSIFGTERELFGFVLEKQQKYPHFIRLNPSRPKKKVFRRGYNDQGSRRLPHERHDPGIDISDIEEQNRIEEYREKILPDSLERIKGFIQ